MRNRDTTGFLCDIHRQNGLTQPHVPAFSYFLYPLSFPLLSVSRLSVFSKFVYFLLLLFFILIFDCFPPFLFFAPFFFLLSFPEPPKFRFSRISRISLSPARPSLSNLPIAGISQPPSLPIFQCARTRSLFHKPPNLLVSRYVEISPHKPVFPERPSLPYLPSSEISRSSESYGVRRNVNSRHKK